MIRIHKDGRYYWADIVDLHNDRSIGITFRHTDKKIVLQEAISIQARYDEEQSKQKEKKQ